MVFGVLLFLLPVAVADDPEPIGSDIGSVGRQEASRTVAVELLAVGIEEYKQVLFEASYNSLTRAQKYKKYLTDAENAKLSKYLKAAKDSVSKKKEATEHIRSADRLIRQGQFIRAKAHLKAVDGSGLLTTKEKDVVENGLKKIEGWLKEQEKQIKQIYDRSVELYNEGQFDNARAGFIEVAKNGLLSLPDGQTAEDYIHKIDTSVGKIGGTFTPTDLSLYESESTVKSGSWSEDGGILNKKDKVNANKNVFSPKIKSAELAQLATMSRKNSVAQGYTQAIVKDALTKARGYIKNSNFYQAQKSIDNARKALNENRLYLDADDFDEYNRSLKKLEEEVSAGRKKWLAPLGSDSPLKQ